MRNVEITDKFPDMTAIKSAPSMYSINGFGLSTYGARDKDVETETYVKTHCIIALFVPIFALGAYRVSKAPSGGWYFIGKEPLSILAKAWNCLVAILLISCIGSLIFNRTYNSPIAKADRKISKADQALEAGELLEAANDYRAVAFGGTDRASVARKRLVTMHEHEKVQSAELGAIAAILKIEIACRKEINNDAAGKAIFEAGMDLVARRGSDNPEGANNILSTIEPVVFDDQAFNQKKFEILDQLVRQQPENVAYVGDFATALEGLGRIEECEPLLAKHEDNLGETEGARILGQIRAGQGRLDEAEALLDAYCENRIIELKKSESKFERIYQSKWDFFLKRLSAGDADKSFYTRYDSASEAKQNEMVDTYIAKKIKNDPQYTSARDEFTQATKIVPVAIDLGVIKLQLAQKMADPGRKESKLKRVEEIFTSVQNLAGESNEFRLYMGQVNYWLGKFDEGKKQFDELLSSSNRSYEMLIAVSSVVREVGRTSEARALAEEAYKNGNTDADKHDAASMRAAMAVEQADQLKWLERTDLSVGHHRAAFEKAKGNVALTEGNYEEAEKLLRKSVESYDSGLESLVTLNNSGLSCITLYSITKDKNDLNEGIRRLEKAISLNPADSIVLRNSAASISIAAYSDIVDDKIDMKLLHLSNPEDVISYLYNTEKERETLAEKLTNHIGFKKSLELYRKAMLLAPKNVKIYQDLANMLNDVKNKEELVEVLEKMKANSPETDQGLIIDFYAGKGDETYREIYQARIDHLKKTLKTLEPGSLTYACAVGTLVDTLISAAPLMDVSEIRELLDEAQTAHDATPSSSTYAMLFQIHLVNAHFELMESNDDYRTFAGKAERYLPFPTIVVWCASNPKYKDSILANPNFQKARTVNDAANQGYSNSGTGLDWAMERFADPAKAEAYAKKIAEKNPLDIYRDIVLLANPASVSIAVDRYFRQTAVGRDEEAKAVIRALEKFEFDSPFRSETY